MTKSILQQFSPCRFMTYEPPPGKPGGAFISIGARSSKFTDMVGFGSTSFGRADEFAGQRDEGTRGTQHPRSRVPAFPFDGAPPSGLEGAPIHNGGRRAHAVAVAAIRRVSFRGDRNDPHVRRHRGAGPAACRQEASQSLVNVKRFPFSLSRGCPPLPRQLGRRLGGESSRAVMFAVPARLCFPAFSPFFGTPRLT